MASLAEIRAKLKAAESKGSDNNRSGGDKSIYPFWNLKEGGESTLRFLPDGNQDNTFFLGRTCNDQIAIRWNQR